MNAIGGSNCILGMRSIERNAIFGRSIVSVFKGDFEDSFAREYGGGGACSVVQMTLVVVTVVCDTQ